MKRRDDGPRIRANTLLGSQARPAPSASHLIPTETRVADREIAGLLVQYRIEQGITQQELGHRVGTSSSQISRIESGRHHTSLSTLRRLADALGLRLVLEFERADSEGDLERSAVRV